jgi:hypothetical protein
MRKYLGIFIVIILSVFPVFGQFKMRSSNLYSDVPLNLKAKVDGRLYPAKELSFGGNICVGNEFINSIAEYNFHMFNVRDVPGGTSKRLHNHEFLLGLRYYAMRPTFLIKGTAIRLTAGGSMGFDLETQFISQYFFGFCLTGVRNASGIIIQAVRRAANPVKGMDFQPYWSLRLGIVIGPDADGPK